MIVIDASVLADFLLERSQAVAAVRQELAGGEHEPLHAPEVVDPETLNALRKLALRGAVTPHRAAAAARDLDDVRLLRYPHEPLRRRMWELRDRLSAHDAAYLALAEILGGARILTADHGLAEQARQVLGDGRVRAVG